MKSWEFLKKFIEENPNGVLGGLCGILFGLLIIAFGILNTIILILSTVIGFLIGRRL